MPAADVLRDMTVQCLRDSNEHTLSGMYDTVEGTVIIKPPWMERCSFSWNPAMDEEIVSPVVIFSWLRSILWFPVCASALFCCWKVCCSTVPLVPKDSLLEILQEADQEQPANPCAKQLWRCKCVTKCHCKCTHTRLTAFFPGLPRWAGTRKVKPIWILLKQETVSGSGIHWGICKSASSSRQITMPAPHHSVFLQAGCLLCRPINSVKAL